MRPSLFSILRPSPRLRGRMLLAGIAFILVLAGTLVVYARYFGPVDPSASVSEFIVTPDDTFEEIASELKTQGYLRSITAFRIAYAKTGNLRGIREGGYELSANMDAWTIAELLSKPPYLAWITFPPGWRKEQIADFLTKKLDWTPEQKLRWITIDTAPSFAQTEGVYYGDTYLIPSDQEPAQIAARLRGRFEEVFAPYAARAVERNVTWTEALTMASLIEREAAKDDKRLISGILWNRVNDGMPLQVDATLQYIRGAEGDWWPTPTPEDKKLDSLFNTYKYRGLPPHPIANPSLGSIEAALNPEKTTCLYYLHDTKGEIHCSVSYAGHKANVQKYLK